ncbi:MAG: nucleotidyltransferase substrate binding protein [Elusimicrobia bacterium]|nr:nucleotidyltransferase substrate binding protein [Elusimicrobiota bacterium]
MSKLEAMLSQFEKAVEKLSEVLEIPKTDIVRDSAIQRFEFCADLAWKTLKAYLEEKKGLVSHSPKDCFRQGYASGIIDYDDTWLRIVDMRNETVHTYKEEIANGIYEHLPKVLIYFKLLLGKMNK